DEHQDTIQAACDGISMHRNKLAPVSKPPPEVLTLIFECYALVAPPGFREFQSSREGKKTLGWIEVTHVCRHWRHIALACPGLWRRVSLDLGSRWAELMVARLGSAPMELFQYIEHSLASKPTRATTHTPFFPPNSTVYESFL
ncbi:hypothetical protein BV25DRAFT_1800786, partial [Artomyces pyxidatus]